jgi:hypothetical protein
MNCSNHVNLSQQIKDEKPMPFNRFNSIVFLVYPEKNKFSALYPISQYRCSNLYFYTDINKEELLC